MKTRRAYRDTPKFTDLLKQYSGRADVVDVWTTDLLPGDSESPQWWAHQVFGELPPIIKTLMRIRHTIVRPLGLEARDESDVPYTGFPKLAEGSNELILGMPDKHLTFCVGICIVPEQTMTLTTIITYENWFGHIYWFFVSLVHPPMVRLSIRSVPEPD
jgi:hypothetical protein